MGSEESKAGRKPKYTHATKTIAFRVPIPSIAECRLAIKAAIVKYERKTDGKG